jgi:AcrR family transcriptional regulator
MTPMRADARRNYEALVAAAAELFAQRGTDIPLDEVARRAGVGNATMYRHFPTRRDLLVAVYADEVAQLAGLADEMVDRPGGLFAWLATFVEHVATKRDLALAIPDDEGSRSALFAGWHDRMRAGSGALLERAIQTGEVRPGTDLADLLALANGLALTGVDPTQRARMLDVVRAGLAR